MSSGGPTGGLPDALLANLQVGLPHGSSTPCARVPTTTALGSQTDCCPPLQWRPNARLRWNGGGSQPPGLHRRGRQSPAVLLRLQLRGEQPAPFSITTTCSLPAPFSITTPLPTAGFLNHHHLPAASFGPVPFDSSACRPENSCHAAERGSEQAVGGALRPSWDGHTDVPRRPRLVPAGRRALRELRREHRGSWAVQPRGRRRRDGLPLPADQALARRLLPILAGAPTSLPRMVLTCAINAFVCRG